MAQEKTTKLEKEELNILQKLSTDLQKLKNNIAELDIQKYDNLNKVNTLKSMFLEEEKKLIEKYGAEARINLQTGEVTQKTD